FRRVLFRSPLLESAALSILGNATPHYDLKIWHGFNLPLVMSLTALAGGILLMHLLRHQNHVRPGVAPLIYRFDGRRTFELLMEGIDSLSAALLNRLYSSGLQRQLLLVTAGAFVVALIPLMRGGWLSPAFSTPANLFFLTLWL